jgi:hypothetical protein
MKLSIAGNGLADRVVSAGSVPPPWGGLNSSSRDSLFICGVASATMTKGEQPPSSVPHPKYRSVVSLSHRAALPLCMDGIWIQKFSQST